MGRLVGDGGGGWYAGGMILRGDNAGGRGSRPPSDGVTAAMPTGDCDYDGDWDATDAADIGSNYTPGSAYAVRRDADLDGDVDAADVTHANSITGGYQTLGRDVLTSTAARNRIGYAGYQYDPTFSGLDRHLFHVRHRVYDAELGRWTRRDPLGYVDGMGLYEYVRSRPTYWSDPDGLLCSGNPPAQAVQAAHVLFNSLVASGMSEMCAAVVLARMAGLAVAACVTGYSVEAIIRASQTASTCAVSACAVELLPRVPVPDWRDLVRETVRKARAAACEAAKAAKRAACKDTDAQGRYMYKKCTASDCLRGVALGDCSEMAARAAWHAACANARLLEMMACGFPRKPPNRDWPVSPGQGDPTHWNEYWKSFRNAEKCMHWWIQCELKDCSKFPQRM